MGYIVGGKTRQKILAGTESNFRDTVDAGFTSVPDILPKRSVGSLSKTGASYPDVTRNAPLFNDPRYTSSTLSIPTDSRTLNGLYRFFAETDPIVGAALSLHRELPLTDLQLGSCEDTGVQSHYEEMWDRIDGLTLLGDITSEIYEIGDVTAFGAWNESDYMWNQFAILNPDYVKIESTWVNQQPLIKLIPDEALKKIVSTQSPKFIYNQLPPDIIRYVLFNKEIPLEPTNVFHIANTKRPYETHGRSLIKRILKVLMLEDRFNQANFALATRHAVPMTIVKVGAPDGSWIPSDTELDAVRDMMSTFEMDPNFTLIWHSCIDVQFYGSNGRMLPIGPELDRIYRLKFIGLNVHEALLAGQGGSYAQSYVNLEVQRQRYLNLQLKLENFMHNGVFKPVADLCGFYKLRSAVAGYGGVSKTKYGKDISRDNILSDYTTLRDEQDNKQFQMFIQHKADEANKNKQIKEYIFPKLDWGQMSAATDENLKNYVKWLAEKRPYLVDDATLARLARLDRDTHEKAYISDLERKEIRYKTINDKGLLPFVDKGKGGGGEFDFGGGGSDMGMPSGDGGGDMGGGMGGEEPNAPIGQNGPPESSNAQLPNAGPTSRLKFVNDFVERYGSETIDAVVKDDIFISSENASLMRQLGKKEEKVLTKIVG